MAKPINQIHYLTEGGDPVYISKEFIYNVEIYEINKFGCQLSNTTKISINDNNGIKTRQIYKNDEGITIIKSLELISAPEEYLINNNYIKNEN